MTLRAVDAQEPDFGDPRLPERFWGKARLADTGCWQWFAHCSPQGYSRFLFQRRQRFAYAVAYEVLVGEVPSGLVLDHLCRNRACVNPAHLEPVTERENILRGEGLAAQNAKKTHCPAGHPYDEINTYVNPSGYRHCRTCRREWKRLETMGKAA